jgi:nickel/cobalt exporter
MDLAAMVQQDAAAPALMLATALVLGALHALEPGHSKTVMAAFIIAVRGTVGQAVLLGLAAAVSHSLIVWAVAIAGLAWGDATIAETLEPWLLTVSGLIILGFAGWVFATAWRRGHAHSHGHHRHGHDHGHHDEHHHDGLDEGAHAAELRRRFASGRATTWQILGFGISGGLIPCAAAVTVLLICLQVKRVWLGIGLVAAFSAGLALTLVAVGVITAAGVAEARRRTDRFDALFARAPYLSAALIAAIGTVMALSGLSDLA